MGIVHRDLKPDNIFITEIFGEKDFVKVLDFGIAKSTEGPEQEALTQTGFICGTPRYLSPEQAMGRPVDARSDLYALGILLYELVAGSPPFLAPTPIGIVMKHIREEAPRLSSDGSIAGNSLSTLVQSLLEKTPSKRPATASAVAEALDAIAHGSPSVPTASQAPPAAPARPSALAAPEPEGNATMMLEGPPQEPSPEATQFLQDPMAAFPPRAPEVPVHRSAPPLSSADEFEPTLARGLPPLDSIRPNPAAMLVKTPSGLTRRPKTSSSLPAVDAGRPVESVSMVRTQRHQPTDEIRGPTPSRAPIWIGVAIAVAVLAALAWVAMSSAGAKSSAEPAPAIGGP